MVKLKQKAYEGNSSPRYLSNEQKCLESSKAMSELKKTSWFYFLHLNDNKVTIIFKLESGFPVLVIVTYIHNFGSGIHSFFLIIFTIVLQLIPV